MKEGPPSIGDALIVWIGWMILVLALLLVIHFAHG